MLDLLRRGRQIIAPEGQLFYNLKRRSPNKCNNVDNSRSCFSNFCGRRKDAFPSRSPAGSPAAVHMERLICCLGVNLFPPASGGESFFSFRFLQKLSYFEPKGLHSALACWGRRRFASRPSEPQNSGAQQAEAKIEAPVARVVVAVPNG